MVKHSWSVGDDFVELARKGLKEHLLKEKLSFLKKQPKTSKI